MKKTQRARTRIELQTGHRFEDGAFSMLLCRRCKVSFSPAEIETAIALSPCAGAPSFSNMVPPVPLSLTARARDLLSLFRSEVAKIKPDPTLGTPPPGWRFKDGLYFGPNDEVRLREHIARSGWK